MLALRAAITEARERVGGLARLRYEERGATWVERGLAVAELRGDIDLDGKSRPALEPVFGDEASIKRGAAGRDRETADIGEVDGQRRDFDAVRGEIGIGRERMADHFRLLVDLLSHEVAIVALVDEETGGERAGDRPLNGLAGAVADGDALPGQHRPVAVLEVGDGIGEGGERNSIGAHEHLARAVADGERAALARHDHQIVVAAEYQGEREGALETLQRVENGADRVAASLELAGDEMGDDLGIGVARERGPFRHELSFQLVEVLDDAVMHHRHLLRHMRVRICLDGLAMGGPARMPDACIAEERGRSQPIFQIAQLALGAPPSEMPILDGRHAGRIVAAIFESLQRVDELCRDRSLTEDANNAAHRPLLPRPCATS